MGGMSIYVRSLLFGLAALIVVNAVVYAFLLSRDQLGPPGRLSPPIPPEFARNGPQPRDQPGLLSAQARDDATRPAGQPPSRAGTNLATSGPTLPQSGAGSAGNAPTRSGVGPAGSPARIAPSGIGPPDIGPPSQSGVGPPPGNGLPPPGPPDTLSNRTLQHWALSLLVEAIVLLPLVLFFAHTLSAPLRRLADAARVGGQGTPTAPLPPEGPQEVRAALECFNAMQERLNKLIRERTNMVGAIAHDLRTPLTRLAFRLDDLPSPLGEKVRSDIEEMKSMLSAALDFIRERSVTGQPERLDFRSLVERVVDEQSDLGHDVTLEPGSPLTIEGVPLALRRVVANVVENALKYGQRARLRLSSDDGHCFLQIDDDGPGIPENLQSQVFDPFFRIEPSRNRQTGGIGLGLTAVRAIVVEHQGEVRLANRKGGGLKVTVQLPLTRA
jgi:two-component system, OmpR family, sensor kinase